MDEFQNDVNDVNDARAVESEVVEINEYQGGPEGIGGWLILVLIGMGASIITNLVNLSSIVEAYGSDVIATVEAYTGKSAQYKVLLGFEALTSVVILIVIIVAFVLMFQKSEWYPVVMSGMYLASFVIVTLDAILVRAIFGGMLGDGGTTAVIRSVLVALLWVNYFRVSVRVRNTFGRNGMFS